MHLVHPRCRNLLPSTVNSVLALVNNVCVHSMWMHLRYLGKGGSATTSQQVPPLQDCSTFWLVPECTWFGSASYESSRVALIHGFRTTRPWFIPLVHGFRTRHIFAVLGIAFS